MAKWNSGAIWNRKGNEGGFTWNSRYYLFVVRLNDTMRAVDGLSEQMAKLILQDTPLLAMDALVNAAFYEQADDFQMESDIKVSLLFALAEELGVKDELSDLIISLFLDEKWSALEDIKLLANLLIDDDASAIDETYVRAFQSLRDAVRLEDLKAQALVELFLHDRFGVSDHDKIRTAVSDLLIGSVGEHDKAFDYLEPMFESFFDYSSGTSRDVGMRIDWANTEIVPMPEASHTEIDIPGVDGSIIQNTVYRDRLFKITAFSEDSLSIVQKEDLKRRITEVLDSTKKKSKKLTVQARGIMFDAKYDSSTISDGPSYVKMEADFTVGPYGFDIFPNVLNGSGLVSNIEGAAPLRVVHKITGPVTNPSFQLGTITYTYRGIVPSQKTLVIDHDKFSCYIIDNFGNKQNVLNNLTGDFQQIEPRESAVLVASSNTESRIETSWFTPLLW